MSGEAQRENRLYQIFYAGVVLKGLNAALEIILGVILITTSRYTAALATLLANELVEDPSDFFARHADRLAPYITPHFSLFAGLYLLSHGVVKGFIIWGLLRKRLWAYPAGIAVFALFVAYQVVKWFETHSIILAALTIFDLAIIALIWHEYRRAMHERSK